MPEIIKCQECGTELTSAAAEGLCPHCLMRMGIRLSGGASNAEGSGNELPVNARFAAERNHTQFGDYELLEEIAHGGMGVVYRARQISLNRIVAVKMLLFGKFSSDEFVRRFQAEAKAAARLQHPNIVTIHEIGEHEGQPFYSMDYVQGKNLAELTKGNACSAKKAAAYVRSIAQAVQFAHEHGILHRDLKPSNVIIDAFDHPRLTDFGLAKQLSHANGEETATSSVLGSPGYMPPEQTGGKAWTIGPTADVYSTGAILYHLITGRAPFTAETMADTLFQVVHADPIAPRWLNPSIPRDLETICLKCLEKSPVSRYPTAQELAEELDRFLRGAPIEARQVNRLEKTWRWCRRQPALAALIALLLVAACGSTAAAFLFNRLRAEANQLRESSRLARYASGISAAQWDLSHGNANQAIHQLIASRPTSGENDLRGFEWRYLWRLSHPKPVRSLPQRKQVLGEMKVSPDGNVLAAYYWDDTLRLWDLRTQEELLAATNACSVGAFDANGRSLLAGFKDGSLRRYDLTSKTWSTLLTKAAELMTCADGAGLAVVREPTGEIKVLAAESGAVKFLLNAKIERYLDYGFGRPVAISADGKTLALVQLGSDSRSPSTIRLWDGDTGRELPALHGDPETRVLRFSPNGRLLVVGCGNGTVHIWDWAAGKSKRLELSNVPILALAFSEDGRLLATGDAAGRMHILNPGTGEDEPARFAVQNRPIWSLAFLEAGKLLATGSRDFSISIWNASGNQAEDEVKGILSHDWGNFVFSSDGASMAGGCQDGHVRVWSVADLRLLADLRGASYAVAFTPDHKSLLTATHENIPELWDLSTQTSKPVPHYAGTMAHVKAVDIAADCRTAALGLADGRIQLLDIVAGRELASWQAHTGEVKAVSFSPDGQKLLSGGRDRTFSVWDLKTQTLLGSSTEHKGAVCAVTYSHTGKIVASACGSGAIKLWNADYVRKSEGSLTYQMDAIRALAFSMDDRTLASGSDDRTIKLWNVALGQSVLSFEMASGIQLVTFSPDGNTLAVVTSDGTLKLFRAATLIEADAEDASRIARVR